MRFAIAYMTCLNKRMQTNQTQPFTSIVGWTKANIYYVGVKYAKGCNPSDLGTTYFTSSKKIRAIWAYIEPDFKCIYPFDTREEALSFEEVLQREFDVLQSKQFANQTIGGKKFCIDDETRSKMSASHTGKTISEKTRAKMSAAKLGKPRSEETKAKMSAAKLGKAGKALSEETRAKISAALKGKPHSVEARAKMSTAHKGKTHSEEVRAKMSTAHKGRTVSDETRAKLSAALKGTRKTEEQRKAQSIATKKWWDERKAK